MFRKRSFVINNVALSALVAFYCLSNCNSQVPQNKKLFKISNDQIQVKLGESFIIELSSDAGQGFSWQIVDSSRLSHWLVYQNQKFRNKGKSVPGGTGIQTFSFKAITTGSTEINFVYVKPFDRPWPINATKKKFIVKIDRD